MWRRGLYLAAFLAVLTAVYAAPLSSSPGTVALDLGPDTRLFLWTLAWDAHALATAPLSVFDANIFYPESQTLAYSEHQLGSALLAAPLLWLGAGPVLALNLVLLASCLLSGIGAYVLARELGLRPASALVCGCIYAFTPPRFFRLGQLHLATVQWIPFCLAAFHRYAREGRGRYLGLAIGAFSLQAWSGGQSAMFLAMSLALLGGYLLAIGRLSLPTHPLRDALLGTSLLLGLNLPFVLPYLEVQRTLGLERSLAEARYWSPNLESFLASPTHVHELLLGIMGLSDRVAREAKAFLFPGIVPLALLVLALRRRPDSERRPFELVPTLDAAVIFALAIALVLQLSGGLRFGGFSASDGSRAAVLAVVLLAVRLVLDRKSRFASGMRERYLKSCEDRAGAETTFYLWLLALATWASLGPSAGLYTALYEVVPGFDFIRVPSRLTLLSVLALAVLAGAAVDRYERRGVRVAWLAASLALVEFAAFPLEVAPYELRTTPMDAWLASQPGPGAVAVLPIPDPRDEIDSARSHSRYMLQSIDHFRPLVNGYSGFLPPDHEVLFRQLSRFPEDGVVERLEQLGVRYVVLHRRGYQGDRYRQVDEAARSDARLNRVASFEEGDVYEISRPSARRGSSRDAGSRSSSDLPASGR